MARREVRFLGTNLGALWPSPVRRDLFASMRMRRVCGLVMRCQRPG